MPPEQEGVTQDDESGEAGDKGLFRFMRRRPAKEKRSETEWVDTLRAQSEPEPEPEEEPESPFMTGEEAEEAPEAPPAPEPEPTPEQYRVERQWRRRHKDEMDEIHSYIDRVIGTDRDPLVRHRRMAEIGVSRHPGKKREIANVQVEGLDEELMIAFTFPKEELRGARMVYETEGGYVIEVTRAVGGDDAHIERQHYTVSRVGSVAHALDKLRAREIEQKIQENEGPGQESAFPEGDEEPYQGSGTPQEEEAALEERESPPVPAEETAPEETTERHLEEAELEAPAPGEEEESGKSGFMGGFASRFKRERPEPVEAPPAEQEPEEPPAPAEQEEAPAPSEETEEEPPAKRGGFGAIASKLKPGKGKGDRDEAPEEEETAPEPPELSEGAETPEGPGETGEKRSPFGTFASRFKRSEGPEGSAEPEAPTEPATEAGQEPPRESEAPEDETSGKKGLFGMKRRGKKGDEPEDEA